MQQMLRFLATMGFSFVLLSTTAYSGNLANYYGADGVAELKSGNSYDSSLMSTVERFAKKNRKNLGYTTAKKYLFGKIYLEKEDSTYILKDVYCKRVLRSDQGWKIGPMMIPPNGEVNCEHTWPQSRFNSSMSKGAQKSDLHHLFPTDSKANGVRGNYPFAEVSGKPAHKLCDASLIGSPLEPSPDLNDRNRFFEPPQDHRGNLARALFYFSVVYHLPISVTEEAYLRRWHNEDPVDELERKRHDMIMDIQGNRNPFIDFPALTKRISDF